MNEGIYSADVMVVQDSIKWNSVDWWTHGWNTTEHSCLHRLKTKSEGVLSLVKTIEDTDTIYTFDLSLNMHPTAPQEAGETDAPSRGQ